MNCLHVSNLLHSLVTQMEQDSSGWLDFGAKETPVEQKLTRLLEFLKRNGEHFVFFFDNVDKLSKADLTLIESV